MTVGWYLGRAIPWATLLACCGAAGLAAAALHRWPSTTVMMLPAVLGCCAAAASFVFDERDTAVAGVTPRAAWRRRVRLSAAALPLAVWTALVTWPARDVSVERSDWWLTGAAAILIATGAAGVASRGQAAAPGALVSCVIGMAVFVPLVVGSVIEMASLYPFDGFTDGVRAFWLTVGALGLAACGLALRPAP